LAQLPMEPWQAAMLLHGAEHGAAPLAARIALLVQERGLGGRSEDLAQRLARWSSDRSPRAQSARKLAEGWAKSAARLAHPPVANSTQPAVRVERSRDTQSHGADASRLRSMRTEGEGRDAKT